MAHMAMTASDGALRRLFEKPLPENPSLLDVLAACNNHIHHKKQLLPPVDPASFTEIFGELHFHEKPDTRVVFLPPPPTHPAAAAPVRGPTASWLDVADHQAAEKSKDDSSLDALLRPPKPATFSLKKSASFCLKKSSASLLLCTEGLGSESTVDSDDMVKGDGGDAALSPGMEAMPEEATLGDAGPGLLGNIKDKEPPSFPPPIRSIGRGGKPCVCFRTFREDGRFVLRQVVIPGKELLQASREGGRLRLQFVAAAAGDEDDEELELGGQEDRGHEENTRCMIGACA